MFTIPHASWLGGALVMVVAVLFIGLSVCLLVVALHKQRKSFVDAAKWTGVGGSKSQSYLYQQPSTKCYLYNLIHCLWMKGIPFVAWWASGTGSISATLLCIIRSLLVKKMLYSLPGPSLTYKQCIKSYQYRQYPVGP